MRLVLPGPTWAPVLLTLFVLRGDSRAYRIVRFGFTVQSGMFDTEMFATDTKKDKTIKIEFIETGTAHRVPDKIASVTRRKFSFYLTRLS